MNSVAMDSTWFTDKFKEALTTILQSVSTTPHFLGHIEPGKTYVLQIKNQSEVNAENINSIIKAFEGVGAGCKLIILGPTLELVSPITKDEEHSRNKIPQDNVIVIVEDDDEPD